MLAVVCDTPGVLRLVERQRPEPGPGEVVLRIRRMGVCGTDLHIFQGKHPFLEYPRVMGHELSGEVAAAGRGAGLAEGTPVYVMPYLTCGRCIACRQGKTNCCTSLQCLGVHCDGGMAEYLALPATVVFPTDGLPLDQAALVEFLAIGAHAARRAEIRGGERTLVVGAGPIGIATALFARARGAQVTLLDPRADRLAFCRDVLGLGEGLAADADTRERLAERTGGDFFDLVFDATGNAAAMEQSFGWVAHGGTLVFVRRGPHRPRLLRPGFPSARADAEGQPQRHRRGLPRGAGGDPRRQHTRPAPDHASGQPRGGARALPRVDPAGDRRGQGHDRALSWPCPRSYSSAPGDSCRPMSI